MEMAVYISLYVLFAFVQAILVSRYLWTDPTAAVFKVIMMTVLAPVVSALLAIHYSGLAIKWLAVSKKV